MPNASTIFDWIQADPEFAKRYAHARELQAEAMAEEIVDISDTANCRDSAAAAKVKMDARKWIAAHLLPKKWGDKPDNEINVSTVVHNHITAAQQQEYQERMQKALG